jgi:hypothetical protein
MPLPTPDELGAQLYFNLGRGAKGNLWFTFLEDAGERYPATKKALQQYSRVVRLLEKDLLLSDPWHGNVTAPDGIDVANLITPDKLIMFITNVNYQIGDSAYQWTMAQNVKADVSLPEWFTPEDGFEISPESGVLQVKWKMQKNSISVTLNELNMGKVMVFTANQETRESFQMGFTRLLKIEK